MVQHDKAVMRPKGADFYIDRPIHQFQSPCRFHRWRATLVQDFVHLMSNALNQSKADFLLWLEDDVVLHPNWRDAIAGGPACLTSLHACGGGDAPCDGRRYNGIGALAVLFPRASLEAILPDVRAGFKSAPLDELLLAVCSRREAEVGPAVSHSPGLARHTGSVVVDTTKTYTLDQPPVARFLNPLHGAVIGPEDVPMTMEIEVTGLVPDAEYSWLVFLDGEPVSEPGLVKPFSPANKEECSDSESIRLSVGLAELFPEGPHEIHVEISEQESDEGSVVAEAGVSVTIVVPHAAPPPAPTGAAPPAAG